MLGNENILYDDMRLKYVLSEAILDEIMQTFLDEEVLHEEGGGDLEHDMIQEEDAQLFVRMEVLRFYQIYRAVVCWAKVNKDWRFIKM